MNLIREAVPSEHASREGIRLILAEMQDALQQNLHIAQEPKLYMINPDQEESVVEETFRRVKKNL